MINLFRSVVAVLAIAGPMASGVAAQEFPKRPVVIVVGPGPDAMPRLFGHKLSEIWNQ